MLSSFTTGGSFDVHRPTAMARHRPGLWTSVVLIISRASGAPLIANALSFADELVRGGVQKIAKAEFALADKAGLEELLRLCRGAAVRMEEVRRAMNWNRNMSREEWKSAAPIPPSGP